MLPNWITNGNIFISSFFYLSSVMLFTIKDTTAVVATFVKINGHIIYHFLSLNFFNYFCKTNIIRINLTFYTPPIPKIILLFVLLLLYLIQYFLTELLMVTYISLLSLLNICYYYCQCLLNKIF